MRISGFSEWQVGWKVALREKLVLFQKDEFGFFFERVVQVANLFSDFRVQRKICDRRSLLSHLRLDGMVLDEDGG